MSGWNVLPAFFICPEIYITVSMKGRNDNFISSGLSIYSGVSAGEAQHLVCGREIYSAVRVGLMDLLKVFLSDITYHINSLSYPVQQ